MQTITVLPGSGKDGTCEAFTSIELQRGKLYTIVGSTGSGKSRFIKDIEQLAGGDSITHRHVLLDNAVVPPEKRQQMSSQLVAHLGQNMRFVLDSTVDEFLHLHAHCRGCSVTPSEVLALTNEITPEPVLLTANLNELSGGQSRALMIADIALICDSPVVLIDEIENAGIDKERALQLLQSKEKLVLVVTHDTHTALMSHQRIVLRGGAVCSVVTRTDGEAALYKELGEAYHRQLHYQTLLRKQAAENILSSSLVTDMPIGAYQAVRQQQANTALCPSLYGLRADEKETFLYTPQEGAVLIPSYFCARKSLPEDVARYIANEILCQELCDFYVANGDLILYPACTTLHSKQETGLFACPSAKWLEALDPEEFLAMYTKHLPSAVNVF